MYVAFVPNETLLSKFLENGGDLNLKGSAGKVPKT